MGNFYIFLEIICTSCSIEFLEHQAQIYNSLHIEETLGVNFENYLEYSFDEFSQFSKFCFV